MKGIILAGGSASRLYPLTKTVSKQLLPVYDKPMIYYPLSTLMLFGIKDILIISTPKDIPNIETLFGNGSKLGINIQYAIQNEPKGIAQAFTIGADFINNDDVCLILGDNIFYMEEQQMAAFRMEVENNQGKAATIFVYRVADPKRFGVVEFDKDNNVLSIEEKPKEPKSNFVSVGLYFYPSDVVKKAGTLQPSARGELEITDLNNLYLKEGRINAIPMNHGDAWIDAGTPDSLMESGIFVAVVEKRLGLKIGCIEEIAYKHNFINDEQMMSLINELKQGDYRSYLQQVYEENKHEFH